MSSVTIQNVTKTFGNTTVLENFDAVFADGEGNDVLFARLCCSAADGPVVAFAAPGGEVNFPGFGMKRRGHLPPGVLHRLAGLPPGGVDGTGIARLFREEG